MGGSSAVVATFTVVAMRPFLEVSQNASQCEFRAGVEWTLSPDEAGAIEDAIKRQAADEIRVILRSNLPVNVGEAVNRILELGLIFTQPIGPGSAVIYGKIKPNLVSIRDSQFGTVRFRIQCEVVLDPQEMPGLLAQITPGLRTLSSLEAARHTIIPKACGAMAWTTFIKILNLAFFGQPEYPSDPAGWPAEIKCGP